MKNYFFETVTGLIIRGSFDNSILYLHEDTIDSLKNGRLKIEILRTNRAKINNSQKIHIKSVWGRIKIIIDSGNNTILMDERSGGRFELNFYGDNYFSIGCLSTCNGGRFIFNDSKLTIGLDCMISDEVLFQLSDEHGIVDLLTGKIINLGRTTTSIEDHVWVGRGATIMHGLRIGTGSVVGAGSLVTKDIPSQVVCAGIPARVIKNSITWSRDRYSLDTYSKKLLVATQDYKEYTEENIINFNALSRKPEIEAWSDSKTIEKARAGYAVIRKNYPDFSVKSQNIDWTVDPLGDKTWRLYFCSLSWLTAFSYDKSYVKEVIDSCLDYSISKDPQDDPGFWDDHATSYRASYIAHIVINVLDKKNLKNSVFLSHLSASVKKHISILEGFIRNKKWDLSNHRIFQCEALIDLAITFFDEKERIGIIDTSIEALKKLTARTITKEEGTVKEHALFYHVFLMGRIKETQDYLKNNLINDDLLDQETYSKLLEFILLSSPKERTVFGIGDTKHYQVYDGKYTKHFNDDIYISRISRMILEKQDFPQEIMLFEYMSDGYTIIRSSLLEEGLLSIKLDKPFVGPHGHWDALSFCLSKNGHPIIVDCGGPYKYGDPLRYKYFQTQLAHNVVILNDRPAKSFSRILESGHLLNCAYSISITELDKRKYLVRCYIQHADLSVILIDVPLGDSFSQQDSLEARLHIAPTLKENSNNEFNFGEGESVQIIFANQKGGLSESSIDITEKIAKNELFQEFEIYDDRTISKLPPNLKNRSLITQQDGSYTESTLIRRKFNGNEVLITAIQFDKYNKYEFTEGKITLFSHAGQIDLDIYQIILGALKRAGT